MTGELLSTRLVLPRPAPDLVPRPALTERLSAAVERPLTLVAAPAGSGKTSLASTWVREGMAPGPVAWVSLDGERLTRKLFWTLVLTAVEAALPGDRRFRMPGQVDAALVSFMNRMAELTEPLVLVLDDFHELSDSGVMGDLNVLLEHPSSALRIVILTRRDPPLRLVRLRVVGSLSELRAHDLAFTEAEGLALLREAAVPDLAPADAEALLLRTEGWAAGLRMAVLTMRGHPDPAAFIKAFTGADAAVTDYLLTEVLDHLTPCDRRFLLHVALPAAVCGELADAITGESDGARRLQRLAGENAMLEPIDGRPGWFRFHPLLRDLLRAELHAESGAELPRLHRVAAAWLIEAGRVREATRHALAGGDRALVAGIVAHGWIELYLDGGVTLLRSLVDLLPEDAVADEPELALAAAVVYVEDGDIERGDTALRQALSRRDRLPEERRTQFGVAFVVVALRRARLHGDLAAGLAEAREMIGRRIPSVSAPGLQALALASIGIAELWAGDRRRAVTHLEAALGEASVGDHDYVAALALAHLAIHDALEGRHRRAAERSRTAVQIVERIGATRSSAAAAAYGTLAGIEYLWDEPAAAARTLERAVEALEAAPEPPLRVLIAANRTRVLSALGDQEGALAALRFEQLQLEDFASAEVNGILEAQHGLLLDALGEPDEARALLVREWDAHGVPEVGVALARLWLGDGAAADALALVEGLGARSPEVLVSTRVQAHAVAALAHDAQLAHDGAAAELKRALDLAEPRGLRRVLTELGPALRPVLRRELRHETAHRAFVEELLDTLDGGQSRTVAASHPYEPLSERETTVLRFLPTMMSNQEIASELFVSVNTLKTHLKQIYRKLDVASRRDAVERARSMGLLSPGPGLRNRG